MEEERTSDCARLLVHRFSAGAGAHAAGRSFASRLQTAATAAKMRCYWWWLNGNTTADTITRDLQAMKAKGIAGAILVDADGSGEQGNLEVPTVPRSAVPSGSRFMCMPLR